MTLYELSARNGLSAQSAERLLELAGFQRPPERLALYVIRGVAVLAGALGGFGLVLWVAANWGTLGRFAHFVLLQGGVLALSLGAWLLPSWRASLSLLALLATGGLLAFFGQTYQTGADPWQLFAVWAAVTLPLCVGTRSDITWTCWALVVMAALSLWVHAHTDHSWRVEHTDLWVHLAGLTGVVSLCVALNPSLARWTGAGIWSFRLSMALAAMTLTLIALGGLFSNEPSVLYDLGLILLGVFTVLLSQARFFDVFALCMTALGLNVVLVFTLGDALLRGHNRDLTEPLVTLGLSAAGLLAATVALILRCNRRYAVVQGAND